MRYFETSDQKTALVLISGGLDSVLAARLLMLCGVRVMGICFHTPFFGGERAIRSARNGGVDCRQVDISVAHLEMLRNPRYGYGRNLNPCIDCHMLMVREALRVMPEWGGDFLATGEVLGERPMSQNRSALDLVANGSGAGNLLLRPLSARLLPSTLPEEMGWVKRDQLLDISGRSRRRQMELASEWGISEYETPAGGCLLTDRSFSERMRELLDMNPQALPSDVEILKRGRHFRRGHVKIIVGRNESDNDALEGMARPGDVLVKETERPGPTALLRCYEGELNEQDIAEAARLVGIYGKSKQMAPPGAMSITRL